MPKLVAFIVVAIAIVWAVAFVDFGEPAPTEPSSTESPAEEPATLAQSRSREPGPPQPPRTPTAAAFDEDEMADDEDEEAENEDEEGDDEPGVAVRRAVTERSAAMARAIAAQQRNEGNLETNTAEDVAQLGERGEGALSPEHNALMRKYAAEPRNQDWALAEEQALAKLVNTSPFAPVHIHCRTTVCQLWIQASEPEDFARFLEIDGVSELTGADIDTPYSLRGSRLSFFFEPTD